MDTTAVIKQKKCTKCGGIKSLDDFEKAYNASGRGTRCKKCAAGASSAWAKANPDKLKGNLNRQRYLRGRQLGFKAYWETHDPYVETKTKVCAKCRVEQSSKYFPKSACEKDGLQAYCTECAHTRHVTNPTRQMFVNAKARALNKGREFTIKVSDIKIPLMCPVLGIPLNPGLGQRSPGSPTLDRWDNNKGYTPDNIYVISYRANTVKGAASIGEMEKVLDYMKRGVK